MASRLLRSLVVAVLAAALAPTTGTAVTPAARQEPRGLWEAHVDGDQTSTECGVWKLDENKFCVANDERNGLEVGVKFRTSTTVRITGVRIYRVDTATVRASLWEADGTLLARGAFPAGGGHRWQDMSFTSPVTIAPDRTYVASYFTPSTKYAFEYRYFQGSGRTVGPVTALRSFGDEPNGVHCYDDAACGSFPVRSYRDSTYFVTPLWVTGDATADTPTNPPEEGGVDTIAPRAVTFMPAGGAEGVRVGTNATVTFSEPVRVASVTSSTVQLRRSGSSKPVRSVIRYRADRSQVVLAPRSRLRARTRYRVFVSSEILDMAGNRLDQAPTRTGLQDARSTFRTR